MKRIICLFMLIAAFTLISCQKDSPIINPVIKIEIEGYSSNDDISLPQDDTLKLRAMGVNLDEHMASWKINGTVVSNDNEYKFTSSQVGEYNITLVVSNKTDEGSASALITVNVYGKYRNGTIILNEGNMTSENGSLIFISPKGVVTDSVYWRVNNSFLGNTAQDLYIANKKIYIICQNGTSMGGDGMLIVANSETLKREALYTAELTSKLSWPTHIAVIGTNAYIRDNKGVYHFNLSTKELQFVEGSGGAAKNRMAVVGDKVFVPAGKNILVIKDKAVIHTIVMNGSISGVINSYDNNLWVSCTTNPAQINKISSSDYSIIKTNETAEAKIGAGWGATPGISAKGDTLYFSNASTKIYRHIFSQNKTDYMTDVKDHIENAGIVYNNLAVHPKTDEVYFNTIKGYGLNYLINNITVFDFTSATPVLKANYANYTHFPAGIFFTYSY
jgi:hypothetical protein